MIYNKTLKAGLTLAVFLGISNIGNMNAYAVEVPEGFSIENVAVSGTDKEEAKKNLLEYVESIKNKNVAIKFENELLNGDFEKLGGEIKNEAELLEYLSEFTEGNVINRFKIAEDLSKNPKNMSVELGIDKEKLEKEIKDEFGAIEATATDATISRAGNSFSITEEKKGVVIDVDATLETLKSYFANNDDAGSINLSAKISEPRIKKEDLKEIKDILGTYTTDFSSSAAGRATNIKVGTSKINGNVLLPGETLSGYACMNPFTTANGYEVAHAYENGRVVDSVGGGACQIATTLYNASLRAEVGIAERKNHSMTVSYVPASADAAIAGTYKDIKITNNYSSPIYVEGVVSGKKLTFTIWGKEERPANREIEFVSEILSTTPVGITYKDDPSLPAGKNVVESKGHAGRKSRLWKVTRVNGVETDRKLVSSDSYMMSNDIVRRGVGEVPAETQTTEPVDGGDTLTKINEAPPAPVEGLTGPGASVQE